MTSVFGRDAELGEAEAFFSAPEPGLAGLAIVGEAGIGKTTVWEEAIRIGRHDPRAVVLAARPTESEAKLSFAGLGDLLASVSDEAIAALPGPQRRALDVALLRVASRTPPERRLLGVALASVVRTLATEREVTVAIDDVQWLDAPSRAVTGFALRRVLDTRVRVVLSVRTPASSDLLELVPDGRLRRLVLGPLSVAALHGIFAERLGVRFSRPMAVRIAEAAGGSPFYALEIARLVDDRRGASPLPVPADVLVLVRDRVRSLPAESRAALVRAAAAARPDVQLIAPAALSEGEEAGLVEVTDDGRILFSHPLYASAVYSTAPLAQRRAAHRALAAAVPDPEERARHLALAADGPDEDAAASVADAARLARGRGAPDAAADLMELALRLTPAGSVSVHERRLELATSLELTGELERGAAVLEELCETAPDDDLRARALLHRSTIVYRQVGEWESAEFARQAIATARDPVLRAQCQAAFAVWAATVDVDAAIAAARQAVETLEAVDADAGIVAYALASRVRAELFAGLGFDAAAAERALELERTADTVAADVDDRMAYKLGQWLRYVDDFAGARAQLEDAERAADEEGDESSLIDILLNRVALELWAGDWGRAEALSERLVAIGDQLGVPHAPADWRAYLDACLGRLDLVRAAALAADRSAPVIGLQYERSLGIAELAAGLYEDANRHLARALELIEQVGFREPAIWRVEGDAVEAAVAAGDLERAEALVSRFERQAARSRIPWSLAVSARSRGLVLAARGELEPAAATLEQALAAHAGCPAPFERARTLLALGRVRRRLKRKRLARDALTAALAVFEGLGASLWAERTREELQRVTTRKASETLTATEREIARLAASGLTNQTIAERVFVSRKTVEANLARAYRKLGISSRAQLARALDGERPAGSIP